MIRTVMALRIIWIWILMVMVYPMQMNHFQILTVTASLMHSMLILITTVFPMH